MPPSSHGRDFLDIVLWVGYKRLGGGISTPDLRTERRRPECGAADAPEEAVWMHGMHAVVGFLRSRPFGPNSPGFDRYPIRFRRACFVRCRFLRRGRPLGPSLFILRPLRIPLVLFPFFHPSQNDAIFHGSGCPRERGSPLRSHSPSAPVPAITRRGRELCGKGSMSGT